MTGSDLEARVGEAIGLVPGAIAVMGKWEPFMRRALCMQEVAARAAAAIALSEALRPDGPGLLLLSAEGHLRRQPRPGCVMAAEIMMSLGARPEQIRCSPSANRTLVELQVVERMRRALGVSAVVLITADYHLERTRLLLERLGQLVSRLRVMSCGDPVIEEALTRLPPERQSLLRRAIRGGARQSRGLAPAGLNEKLARLGSRWPTLERILADVVRGPVRPWASSMFQPGDQGELPVKPSPDRRRAPG